METILCKLHSVQQRRANTGGKTWVVATFHCKQHGWFKCVGVLADTALVPDLQIALIGKWETGKFGRQFAFTKYSVARPVGAHGVVAFLMQCRGIGPVIADKAFGLWDDKAVEFIAQNPDEAAKALNVSAAKVHGWSTFLKSKLAHITFTLPLTEILHGIPFPKTLPETIVESGMVDPVGQIQNNPFLLTRFNRVGFPLCDQLRKKLGHAEDMPERIMAAAVHAFKGNQSVWIHKNIVIQNMVATLGVIAKHAKQALVSLLQRGELILHKDHLALSGQAENEKAVCTWLIEKSMREMNVNEWPELYDNENLSGHQIVEAMKAFKNGGVATLLGSAGVGKTHTAATIIKCFPVYDVCALAPTAKAAQRLGQFLREFGIDVTPVTIHSALQARPTTEGGWHFTLDGTDTNKLQARLVVIDEISMLDNALARAVFSAIDDETLVLLLGDPGQLPPVGRGAMLRDWMAFCEKNKRSRFVCGELTEVRRNAGQIVKFAAALRKGDLMLPTPVGADVLGTGWTKEYNLQWYNGRSAADQREAIIGFAKKLVAGKIVDPQGVEMVPYEFQVVVATNEGEDTGRHELNGMLQKVINPRMEGDHEFFKVGDRIINLENTYMPLAADAQEQQRIANGEIGYVLRSNPKSIIAKFESCRDEIVCPIGKGRGTLDLGYAITCHKAQGSQFPITLVTMSDGFRDSMVLSREWLFTGVTRSQQLTMIVGPEKALRAAARKTSIWDRKSFTMDWFTETWKGLESGQGSQTNPK